MMTNFSLIYSLVSLLLLCIYIYVYIYNLQDPSYKQVRVASFQRETVNACVELMEATSMESWAKIQPRHVTRRVGLGVSKPYLEIWDHLQVEKGDLLELKGPESWLRIWKNSFDISNPASEITAKALG
jgi:hypothetical protein